MSRSCVCGGENENCRYCGGSGIIGDTLGSALDDTLRRATIENSPTADIKAEHERWPSWSQISVPPPIRWAKCPKGCGRWINVEKVERHLRNCTGVRVTHPQHHAPAHQKNSKREEISFDSCPVCGAKLKAGRIQRHMSKAHGTTTSNPLFAEFVRRANVARRSTTETAPVHQNPSPPQRERTLCPICKAMVNVTRLNKHMAKVHNRRLTPQPTQAASANDPTRQGTTLVAPRDKNLDATKLYAHPYREQGRYGSHPSHDGFDDESTAD